MKVHPITVFGNIEPRVLDDSETSKSDEDELNVKAAHETAAQIVVPYTELRDIEEVLV